MDYEKAYKEALERAKAEQETFLERGNISAKSAIERIFPILCESEDERVRKEIISFLEGFYANKNKDRWIAWLEKQNEKKPANKVEPKFKVGDWIINNDKRIAFPEQILKLEEYGYVTSMGYTSFDKVKTDYHLWTIQDAEDGDVLYLNDNTIVIFKDLYDSTTFHSYCHIENDVFNITPEWWEGKGFQPATKEQRELLFQKMKEAGYEWDSEKKEELKKIEQKPVDNIESSAFKDKLLELFQKFRWSCKDQIPTNGEIMEYVNAHIQELIGTMQKLAWSEEDEKLYTSALWHIKNSCGNGGKDSGEYEVYNWFKSLKDRVQPKQEWSEEDEEIIKEACKIINCYGNIITEQNEANKAYRIADKLKSLKSQTHWKPMEEQMQALDKAKNNPANYYDIRLGLQSLYNDLTRI